MGNVIQRGILRNKFNLLIDLLKTIDMKPDIKKTLLNIRLILSHIPKDAKDDRTGNTVLQTAIEHNKKDIAIFIVASGFILDGINNNNKTALEMAKEKGMNDLVSMITTRLDNMRPGVLSDAPINSYGTF